MVMTSKSKIVVNDFSTFEEWTESLKKFRSVNTMNSVVFDLSELSFHENVSLSTRVDYYNSSKYGRKTQGCFMTLAHFYSRIYFIDVGRIVFHRIGISTVNRFGYCCFFGLNGKSSRFDLCTRKSS